MNPSSQDQIYSWSQITISLIATLSALFLLLRCCNFFKWQSLNEDSNHEEPLSQLQNQALAPVILHALPAVQFRKTDIEASTSPLEHDCAVCLGEFKEGEWLRLLPNCAHVFHISCIDTWFQAHSSCPICRSSVVNDINSYQ